MRLAVVGVALLAAGAIAVLAGVLTPAEVGVVAERVWPILLFVVAVTVVAELAASAGLFDVIAAWLSRLLAVARAHRLDPLPFAFTTVWLANTASLVLPVSNLTNLLAMHRLGDPGVPAFLGLLGLSATVAIVVTVVLLFLVFREGLGRRYRPAAPPRVSDPVLLAASAVVVGMLLPLLVSGLPPWLPATGAAVVLGAVCLWRSPGGIRFGLLPWQLVVFASGLFLAVAALESVGSGAVLQAIAGAGDDPVALWRLAGVGMLGANAVANLPAYLALESAAESPVRVAALLIGVNAGPLVTPWASLATLLWHQRLVAVGVEVSWRRYVLLGLIVAPVTVGLAVVPLFFRA